MAGHFQQGLFNCFENWNLCIVTWFCPCYTAGRVAETLGESCFFHGMLFLCPIIDLVCRTYVRYQIRERRNIEGSILCDCCVSFIFLVPALIQEAREVNVMIRSVSVGQEIVRE